MESQSCIMKLTHVDARGQASMVDVSAKPVVLREALASGEIRLQRATLDLIESNKVAKGNVLATARIAGIQAAKKTGELIPLCHPLPITHCEVNFGIPISRDRIVITASAKIAAQTGIEMEALTAVSVAALTIYDMCKAVDKKMVIGQVKLVSKTKSKLSGKPAK
jgi:cyclic pyranopterin monophosphate synthase